MPSSHSGSSHSSASHSGSSHSSGGFSSHSSSSHSSSWGSSSSSWGSSSSSSDSSSDSSWGSGGLFGALFSDDEPRRERPSRHSETSRSSGTVYRSNYVRSGSMRGTVIDRQRYNQPRGYETAGRSGFDPIPHYCVHHNYFYYPISWTDETTGQEYKKGYYDENGKYYEDVAFLENGQYKSVLCQCEYCDTVTKIDWTGGGSLICPQCGGTMKVLSALDEYTRDPNYEKISRKPDYVDYADRGSDDYDGDSDYNSGGGNPAKAFFVFVAVIIAVLIGLAVSTSSSQRSSVYDPYNDPAHPAEDGWRYLGNGSWAQYMSWDDQAGQWVVPGQAGQNQRNDPTPLTNPELFNEIIYLNASGPDSYVITGDYDHDRELVWDDAEESYFDPDSELWAWYNTEVEPPIWQYWYEPISGDYGDYGWMEYDEAEGIWYIEAEAGQWMPVPEDYDLSPLWHIDYHPYDHSDDSGEDLRDDDSADALQIFGDPLCVREQAPGVWELCDEAYREKALYWNEEEQSWHDEETDLWLWYNTEVDPPLWQYWYEPISGDYGDYGWMEFDGDEGVWYVEIDAGEWIPVPPEYDVSALWHLDTSPVG